MIEGTSGMIEKLAALAEKYDALTQQVGDPEIIANQSQWQKLVKARADLEDVVLAYRQYLAVGEEIAGAEQIISEKSDPELVELAKMDIEENQNKLADLEDFGNSRRYWRRRSGFVCQ